MTQCDGRAFEQMINRVLGDQMRRDPDLCVDMWCALANIEWTHRNGDTASYTFRAEGDLVAAIFGSGDYMDWYCSGPSAQVSHRISEALAAEGWTWNRL